MHLMEDIIMICKEKDTIQMAFGGFTDSVSELPLNDDVAFLAI